MRGGIGGGLWYESGELRPEIGLPEAHALVLLTQDYTVYHIWTCCLKKTKHCSFSSLSPQQNGASPGLPSSIFHADLCLSSSNPRECLGQSSSLV